MRLCVQSIDDGVLYGGVYTHGADISDDNTGM